MRERHIYNDLKKEHAGADHAAKPEAAPQKPSWEEQLDARMKAENDAVTERFKAGKINSRDLVREQNIIDQKYRTEINARM